LTEEKEHYCTSLKHSRIYLAFNQTYKYSHEVSLFSSR